VQRVKAFEKKTAEQAGEHAHGEEEASLAGDPARAVRREAAAGNDHVDVRVMGERRTPGVQDGGEADARAEMLRIGGNGDQRLGRSPEQEVVDDGLVLERDGADRRRQGEHDVIVGNRQEFRLALGEPLARRRALALWTMPVAAGIIGDAFMRAVLATLDVSAERRGPATLDRRHHLQLGEADVPGVSLAPRRPMGAKDVGDLRTAIRGPRHAGLVRRAAIGWRD
jgi:hypothetical protein